MKGGHNRKPAALHVLEGTGRPSRQNGNTPRPRPTAPTCPSWLDKEAKAEWARVAPELERLGLLTVLDRAAFSAYCQSWADFRHLSEIIDAEGAVIEGRRGAPRKHPLLPALHWAMAAVRTWSQEFGLTPLSRSRMSVGNVEEEEEPSWLD